MRGTSWDTHLSILLLLCSLLISVGCGGQTPPAVLVFAAASTSDALEAICQSFQTETLTPTLTNHASSSTLAQQILHGAQVDLFLSANSEWVEIMEERGLVARRVDLLSNRLVIVAPVDSELILRTIGDLLSSPLKHLALADPDSAPAGIYAKQALVNLGLWSQLKNKVVAAADVRQALAYVEQGAVEASIVYATDVSLTSGVRVLVDIPPESHEAIIYPLVLLKGAESEADAEALFAYIQSATAAHVFTRFGFTIRARSTLARGAS